MSCPVTVHHRVWVCLPIGWWVTLLRRVGPPRPNKPKFYGPDLHVRPYPPSFDWAPTRPSRVLGRTLEWGGVGKRNFGGSKKVEQFGVVPVPFVSWPSDPETFRLRCRHAPLSRPVLRRDRLRFLFWAGLSDCFPENSPRRSPRQDRREHSDKTPVHPLGRERRKPHSKRLPEKSTWSDRSHLFGGVDPQIST